MASFYHLWNGVQGCHRRKFYLPDSVSVIGGYKNSSYHHKFLGVVTGTVHNVIGHRTIYSIDEIVRVDTVSDQKRMEVTEQLESGKDTCDIFAGGSFGVMVVGGCLALATNYITCGCIGLGVGFAGALFGCVRSSQFSGELAKWKNPINDHIAVRRRIPEGRYTYIFDNKLIGQYLSFEEANRVWRNDVGTSCNLYRTAVKTYSHKDKVPIVSRFMKCNPLMAAYVSYFETQDRMNGTSALSGRVAEIIDRCAGIARKYDDDRDLLRRGCNGDVISSDVGYSAAQSGLHTMRTVGTVLGGGNSRGRSTIGRVIEDTAYTSATIAIEQARAHEELEIRRSYDTRSMEMRMEYESQIVTHLPEIVTVYESFNTGDG